MKIIIINKIFAPFTDAISEINNIQVDKARDTDVVMTMYNLKEYVVCCWSLQLY